MRRGQSEAPWSFQNPDLGVSSPHPHPHFLPSVVTRPLRRSLAEREGDLGVPSSASSPAALQGPPLEGVRSPEGLAFPEAPGCPVPPEPQRWSPRESLRTGEPAWGRMSLLAIS